MASQTCKGLRYPLTGKEKKNKISSLISPWEPGAPQFNRKTVSLQHVPKFWQSVLGQNNCIKQYLQTPKAYSDAMWTQLSFMTPPWTVFELKENMNFLSEKDNKQRCSILSPDANLIFLPHDFHDRNYPGFIITANSVEYFWKNKLNSSESKQ